jgi:chorismate mutase / prephenate dehydratase
MTIEERRAEIDRIDAELLRIVSLRAQVACELFALKRANGTPVCDPQRELQVVQRAQRCNTGPLDEQAVGRIFRAVIEESRQLERHLEYQFLERQLELQLEPQLDGHIRESQKHKDTLGTKQETSHDR